ncbi:hypothetical protein [Brachyspira pilosicoli]|nr:hypothetical protein [Brachyspira pilosicoli]
MEAQVVQEREDVITIEAKDDIRTLITKYKEQNIITITSKKIKAL